MPSSVNNCRKVNWVGPNVSAFGFSTSIAWVVGVSCREETTGSLKPLGVRPPEDLGVLTKTTSPGLATLSGLVQV
jgi:hypothetical protein